MTVTINIFVLSIVIFLLAFFCYTIGHRAGYRNAMVTKVERVVLPNKEEMIKILELERNYMTLGKHIRENNNKLASKVMYDLLYKLSSENGKIVCSCKNPKTCNTLRLLREYRETHKQEFTEEELTRNDGL